MKKCIQRSVMPYENRFSWTMNPAGAWTQPSWQSLCHPRQNQLPARGATQGHESCWRKRDHNSPSGRMVSQACPCGICLRESYKLSTTDRFWWNWIKSIAGRERDLWEWNTELPICWGHVCLCNTSPSAQRMADWISWHNPPWVTNCLQY